MYSRIIVLAAALPLCLASPPNARGIQGIQFSYGVPPGTFTAGAERQFLSQWMGRTGYALKNLTLLQVALPGTHDTMTYDLSGVVADGGFDDYPELAEIVHDFTAVVPIDWIKTQAQTQAISITDQLNAGVRFLDFRIMFTSGNWYCLHMLQTKRKAMAYLQEVRDWVVAHPTELIVIWLSKHGSTCLTGNDQYPGVSPATKQKLWSQILDLFKGVLFDEATSALNRTSIGNLLARNQRVIIFASDFLEFTGGSTSLALDGCRVDNGHISKLSNLDLRSDLQVLKDAEGRLAQDKQAGMFYLLSMASSPPGPTYKLNAEINFVPGGTSNIGECASLFHVDGMSEFCPATLLDYEQLGNYYHQITLDAAFEAGYAFPNAIYIDGVTTEGLIRTGTRSLAKANDTLPCDIFEWSPCQTHMPTCGAGWTPNGEYTHWNAYASDGKEHTACGLAWQSHYKCCRDADVDHASDGYAYVDTLVAYNVRLGCGHRPAGDVQCQELAALVAQRRAAHPKFLWKDILTGRRNNISSSD